MALDAIVLLRFVKLAGVLALAAGTVGAFAPQLLEDRKRAAYYLAAPGLFVTWAAGLVLALRMHHSPVLLWIVLAAVSSTVGANVVLWGVAREGRRSAVAACVAIFSVLVALAMMVFRPVLS